MQFFFEKSSIFHVNFSKYSELVLILVRTSINVYSQTEEEGEEIVISTINRRQKNKKKNTCYKYKVVVSLMLIDLHAQSSLLPAQKKARKELLIY